MSAKRGCFVCELAFAKCVEYFGDEFSRGDLADALADSVVNALEDGSSVVSEVSGAISSVKEEDVHWDAEARLRLRREIESPTVIVPSTLSSSQINSPSDSTLKMPEVCPSLDSSKLFKEPDSGSKSLEQSISSSSLTPWETRTPSIAPCCDLIGFK